MPAHCSVSRPLRLAADARSVLSAAPSGQRSEIVTIAEYGVDHIEELQRRLREAYGEDLDLSKLRATEADADEEEKVEERPTRRKRTRAVTPWTRAKKSRGDDDDDDEDSSYEEESDEHHDGSDDNMG